MKPIFPASCMALLLACAPTESEPEGGKMPPPPEQPGGKADSPQRSPLWSLYSWNYELSAVDRHNKYCKMAASPFTFYRGSNHLFWEDMAEDPRLQEYGNDKTRTWLQGDLHAYNFGSFENAAGELVYALNDFDESVVADYQYDLWRMAASMVLVAQENGDLNQGETEDFVDSFTEAYLDTMGEYRGNTEEVSRAFDENETYAPLSDFLDDVGDDKDREAMLESWTTMASGQRVFDLSKDKLEGASGAERVELTAALASYRTTLEAPSALPVEYFALKDLARRKLAGTGSLGTPRFYALIEGPTDGPNDDRILDLKEQQAPTPWWFLSYDMRSAYAQNFSSHAARHAVAMSGLVDGADALQGWFALGAQSFSVRERSPYKEGFPTGELEDEDDYQSMAEQWGIVLATAHARADRDYNTDLVANSVDREIDLATEGEHAAFRALAREIAFQYAQQVTQDHELFVDWLAPSDCPAP